MKEYILQDLSMGICGENMKPVKAENYIIYKDDVYQYLTSYFLHFAADRDFLPSETPKDEAPRNLTGHKGSGSLYVGFSRHADMLFCGPGYYMKGQDETALRIKINNLLSYAYEDTYYSMNEMVENIHTLGAWFVHNLRIVELRSGPEPTFCHVFEFEGDNIRYWFNKVLVKILLEAGEADGVNTDFVEAVKKAF